MHPRFRLWLIGALAALTAVVVGSQLANESYLAAALTIGVLAWMALEWFGGPRPESWALAAALAGYVIGNRGFAQLSFSQQFPLLPAESALLVTLAATVFRTARREATLVRRDSLNFAIIVWCLLGASRIWPDFRTFGVVALRDFAMVYYALFFFVAQSLAAHGPSARLLRQAVLVAVSTLPFTFFLITRFPEIFQQRLILRGVPLFFYKDDLVAAYLFAGFFLLLTAAEIPWLWRNAAALAGYASAFTINSSRAAIVGLLVTSGWWAAARRWAPWRFQAAVAPLAVLLLAIVAVASPREFQQSRLYTLYEHVASMADFSGTGRYASEDRAYVGDNNRFRLVWWRSVVEDTWEGGPLLGLGFGADLAERFLRVYNLDLGEEFTARSPHSILFTVLGRMGLVGAISFLGLAGAIVLRTARFIRQARPPHDCLAALGWWSVTWVILASSCFGVVLEGPMGAVLFWTALGLANAMTSNLESSREALASAPVAAGTIRSHPIPAGESK